jgi:hypothetical protein
MAKRDITQILHEAYHFYSCETYSEQEMEDGMIEWLVGKGYSKSYARTRVLDYLDS